MLFALLLAACASPARSVRLPRPGSAVLSIATFNLDFRAASDRSTIEAVGQTGADVVFLQEVSPSWETVLRERYADVYPFMLFAPRGGAGGLGTLSRFPLHDAGFLPAIAAHPAWLIRVGQPPLELHVLNVHLRATRRPGQGLIPGLVGMSADHELEISSFVERSRARPDIVLGDFNEGFRGAAIRWLERRDFDNALARYRPGEPTWRAVYGVFRSTLDHILTRGCVVPLDAWVLRRGRSDHWPVVARLEVTPPPLCH